MCKDLQLNKEEQEYSTKLEKIKKINLLKKQRDSDSSYKKIETNFNIDISNNLNEILSSRKFLKKKNYVLKFLFKITVADLSLQIQ